MLLNGMAKVLAQGCGPCLEQKLATPDAATLPSLRLRLGRCHPIGLGWLTFSCRLCTLSEAGLGGSEYTDTARRPCGFDRAAAGGGGAGLGADGGGGGGGGGGG